MSFTPPTINYTRDRLNRKIGENARIVYCPKCTRKGRREFGLGSNQPNAVIHVVEWSRNGLRYTDVCIVANNVEVAAA